MWGFPVTVYVAHMMMEIVTGPSGTNGDVYLCVGGREFSCNTRRRGGNFGANGNDWFNFGSLGTNVVRPDLNDPRERYELRTRYIESLPVWIRFEPDSTNFGAGEDMWDITSVTLIINPNLPGELVYEAPIRENQHITLGAHSGKFLFLREREPVSDGNNDRIVKKIIQMRRKANLLTKPSKKTPIKKKVSKRKKRTLL